MGGPGQPPGREVATRPWRSGSRRPRTATCPWCRPTAGWPGRRWRPRRRPARPAGRSGTDVPGSSSEVRVLLGHRGLDHAGVHGVDPDPPRTERGGQRVGEHPDGALGDVVGRHRRRAEHAADRGDRDDRALTAAGDHRAGRGLAGEEGALDVDVHHRVVVGLADLEHVLHPEDAGGRDHDRDAAERVGRGDRLLDGGGRGDVARHEDRGDAEVGECPRRRVPTLARLLAQVGDDHARDTRRGQPQRGRPAQARRATGDHGHLPGQEVGRPGAPSGLAHERPLRICEPIRLRNASVVPPPRVNIRASR